MHQAPSLETKQWFIGHIIFPFRLIKSDIPQLTRAVMLDEWEDEAVKRAWKHAAETWMENATLTEVASHQNLVRLYSQNRGVWIGRA